ncbi:hypothetical protein [Streptomyces diastaticus]
MTDRRASWLRGVLDLLVLSCPDGRRELRLRDRKRLDEAGLGQIKGGTL